jgi:hypothetical protein
MANASTFVANKLLDHAFGGPAYPQPTPYVGLFTTTPTMPAGTGGTEVSGTGTAYVRVALTGSQAAAAGGSKSNNAVLTWPQATANYGTVTGVGVFDAPTGGNLMAAGPLNASEVVNNLDTFQFAVSTLIETLS